MRLFSNNIVPYASTEGDKIYPIVVDIKKGIKSGEAISFVTADNQVGVITVDFMDGNSSYSIEGCMVTSTIRRPDGTVLEIPCDIISQSTIEIPLGINGTYQEGVHTFDLKIVRGNGKVIGVPTMSYSVSGSLSSDGVVEGDDRLPVLTMVLDNAQDKLTRLDKAIAGVTNDLEVKEARDGEVTLNARLERDLVNTNRELEKIKKLEESTVTTVTSDRAFTTVVETTQGYFEDVKLEGKTLVNLSSQVNTTINQFSIVASSRYMLKNSTTYTVIITNKEQHSIRLYGNEQTFVSMSTFEVGSRSTIVKKVRTLDEVKSLGLFKSNSSTGTIFNLDLVLLEGDHTDKDISFFEGLKSVGQDTDEISVSSINENLFDGTWIDGTIDTTTGEDNYNTTECKTDYICIGDCARLYKKEFTDTNLPYTHYKTRFFDKNKKYIGSTDTWGNSSEYYDVPNGAMYIRLIPYETNREVMSNVRLIVSKSEITDYVEPKTNKRQILYYNPTTQTWEKPVLREWDSIEKHSDGKYYYHKRSGEVVLDGSESWFINPSTPNQINTKAYYSSVLGIGTPQGKRPNILTDKFQVNDADYFNNNDEVQASSGNHSAYSFMVRHKSNTAEEFKQWLQTNPVTVAYQLAKEEVYECTNLDLITYSGETNLIVNSGAIQPRITLKVLSNISNVVKLLQEKVSVLENKFIEGLKQVLSGNMMALAHLLYPEDFERNEYEAKTLEEL